MSNPTHEPLKKEMHEAEREIDAIENKIANADDSNTYPADYAAMRSEQEQQRQHILKCKAEMDDSIEPASIQREVAALEDLQNYSMALLPLVRGDDLTVALRVTEQDRSKSGNKPVGSQDFERVAHDLKALFSVSDEVLNLARKKLNEGQCVTVTFDGFRSDLVTVGFIEK
jgi:molecular chaperone GrpE (heat shock protein)